MARIPLWGLVSNGTRGGSLAETHRLLSHEQRRGSLTGRVTFRGFVRPYSKWRRLSERGGVQTGGGQGF